MHSLRLFSIYGVSKVFIKKNEVLEPSYTIYPPCTVLYTTQETKTLFSIINNNAEKSKTTIDNTFQK